MSTAVDGIVTGIDTSGLIKSIVAAASTPKIAMEGQLQDMEARREKVAGLSNRLEELSAKIAEMNTVSTFISHSIATSDDSQFTATADGDAVQGAWNVQVMRLASNEMEVTQGVADAYSTGVIEEGTYSLTYKGVTTEVLIDDTNSSLNKLADAFNDVEGITAFVLNTGVAGAPYRLVVQGQDTGDDAGIDIALTGGSGTGTALAFEEKATAQNAWITINGLDVYSPTNQVQDAIPGIALDLKATGTATAALTVSEDIAGMEETIQAFVDSYNEVVSYFATNSVYNAEENIKGPLAGDATSRRVMDTLGSLISTAYTSGTSLHSLGQIGIETSSDGKLLLDSDKLQEALGANFDDVVALFTSDDGAAAKLKTTIDDVFVDEDNGTLSTRTESLQGSIDDIQGRIDDFDAYIENMSSRLRDRFTSMEVAMGQMQSTQTYLAALFASSSS
ncbi:MAG: flagellar filament capping protein FliD [Deltaproteobacteria bacterium]|nr:flagellar filament capping protein FliD [Deltaproteobacteria bacterium]